ncbi:MAG: c-type cytochrome [Bryobacteraceae bacterium]|jgi:mono/diheme cytochrome c family protein
MSLRKQIDSAGRFLFGGSARAFGSLSIVLLAVLAIVPAKDHFREWLHYQHEYQSLIRNRSDGVSLARRFQGGVQQIWLPDLGVVDRCGTCHVALREASLAGIGTQPFQPHPPIPHSLTEFGCVMCHWGQGAATTVEEAHSSTLAWEQPILPARYVESSCGQCHERPLAGTPQLNSGRDMLGRYGCVNCHKVTSPEGVRMTATDHPPSLQHIAAKTTREWIFAWIRNPQAYAATATMPNFQLSEDDARDLSAFLISQSTPYLVDPVRKTPPVPAQDDAASLQQGSSVYGESFCASCHAMQNAAGLMVGGNVGPELTRIGSKIAPEWLAEWLRNPGVYDPDTLMPHYRFEEKDIGLVMGFLGSKTDSDLLANVHLEPATPAQVAHGKALTVERGCAACHDLNGVAHQDNFAPELTAVGSLPLAKIVFVPGMEHTLPDYIAAKIRKPRSFGNALKMPQFTFSDSQVDSLVTALLAQTSRAKTLPAALRIQAAPASTYQPAGRAGQLIADMRCFSCHTINGRGGDMAPDLTWEGSSVQRSWLLNFLKRPNTLRPALIRRMPKFNLSDEEANVLADYIMTVYQTPEFDRDQIDASKFSAADAAQGKDLYYGKYACNSCHIVDPNKDKGYVGPTLTQVGLRLSAAWIFHWLKNAQALRPGTTELNWNMNDHDARAITAFLMQQKAAPKEGASR